MYLFLYGEDTFRAKQKLGLIKEKYLGKVGSDLNLVVKEGENLDFERFLADVMAIPFLATTRLVIVKNPFLAPVEIQRKIAASLFQIPETTVAVFWQEGNADERTVLFKTLNQPKLAEKFNLLRNERLLEWLLDYVEKGRGKIERPVAELLKEAVGSDLWRLTSEIDKLNAYDPKISEENVKKLVVADLKIGAFDMIESLLSGNFRQALRELHELLQNDEEPLKILGAFVYQIRQMILVKSMPSPTPPGEIARRLKISPFVVYRCLRILRRIDLPELSQMHDELLKADIALKTGIIEPRLGLWFLVYNLTEPPAKIKY